MSPSPAHLGGKRTFYIEKGEKDEKGKRLDFSFGWSIYDVDLAWLGLKLDWKVSKLGKRWSRTNFNFFYERRRERSRYKIDYNGN